MADEDEGQNGDWSDTPVVNLASVMPFETTRAAIAVLPVLQPELPDVAMYEEGEGDCTDVSVELLAEMASALEKAAKESGHCLLDENKSSAVFSGRKADPPVLKKLIACRPSLGREKEKRKGGDCFPAGENGDAPNEVHKILQERNETRQYLPVIFPPKNGKPSESVRNNVSNADDSPRQHFVERLSAADRSRTSEQRLDSFVHSMETISSPHQQQEIVPATEQLADLLSQLQLHASSGDLNLVPEEFLKKLISTLAGKVGLVGLNFAHLQDCAPQSKNEAMGWALSGFQASLIITTIAISDNRGQTLVSEDILETIVNFTRTALLRTIFPHYDSTFLLKTEEPYVERGGQELSDAYVETIDKNNEGDTSLRKYGDGEGPVQVAAKVFASCCTLFERLDEIVTRKVGLSETFTTLLSSMAMSSLSVAGIAPMQLNAMALIRSIFRENPEQRKDLMLEARHRIGKVPDSKRQLRAFRLRDDGNSVRVTSALVLQLMQVAASFSDETQNVLIEMNSSVAHAASLKATAIEMSDTFVDAVLRRCFNERDNDYKTALQVFFDDLLVLYGRPEWPAAEIFLESICTLLVKRLRLYHQNKKSSTGGDVIVRTLSIDLLGALAARVQTMVVLSRKLVDSHKMSAIRAKLINDLSRRAKTDSVAGDALGSWLTFLVSSGHPLGELLSKNVSSEIASRKEIREAAEVISSLGSLPSMGVPAMLEAISSALQEPFARLRARALVSLSSFANVDPLPFKRGSSLRNAVQDKCMDISTLVRESALDLLSRVSLSLMESDAGEDFFGTVYPVISGRLADTATSVRKRAVHIIRTLLLSTIERMEDRCEDLLYRVGSKKTRSDENFVADACAKLVMRLDDPEQSVQDAAQKVLLCALFGYDPPKTSKDVTRATVYTGRLIETTVHLAKTAQARFVPRLIRKDAKLYEQLLPLLNAMVACVMREMHSAEGNLVRQTATSPSKESDVRDSNEDGSISTEKLELQVLACSSLLAAFAGVDIELVKDQCRVLSPALKAIPSRGLEVANARNILVVLETCVPHIDNPGIESLNELVYDLAKIIKTSRNDMLAGSAIKCLCAITKCSSTALREAFQLVETFSNFLTASLGDLGGRKGNNLHSYSPALERLGLFARYMGFSEKRAQEVFRVILNWCTVQIPKRDVSIGGKDFVPLQESALRSLSHFIARNRSFLPQSNPILLAAMEDDKSVSSKEKLTLQLRVLCDVQELLVEEEQRNTLADCTLTNANRKSIGAEEDAEAGFLVGTVQTLQASILRTVVSPDKRVRLRTSIVLGLIVRQGLILPILAVGPLISLYTDRADRNSRENAHRVLLLIAERHPQMIASQALPGVFSSFRMAMMTANSAVEAASPVSLAVDNKNGRALLSPIFNMLSAARRRETLEAVVNFIGSPENDSNEQEKWCGKGERSSLLIFLASTLAAADYGGSATSSQQTIGGGGGPSSAEARQKGLRDDVQVVVATTSKHISNTGAELLATVKRLQTSDEGLGAAAEEVATNTLGICLLIKLKLHLRARWWGDINESKDGNVDAELSQRVKLPPLDVTDIPLCIPKEVGESVQNGLDPSVIHKQLSAFRQLMKQFQLEENDFESKPLKRRRQGTPTKIPTPPKLRRSFRGKRSVEDEFADL